MVWITGLGLVTPLGGDAPSSLRRLVLGDRGIGPLTLFDLPGARSTIAAEATFTDLHEAVARTDAMALSAAREALRAAGIGSQGVHLIVGGTTAGMLETEELLTRLSSRVPSPEEGTRLRSHPLSSTVDTLHDKLGPFASTRTVCCACTSGAAAIAIGFGWIRTGRATRVLAGGADALCRLTLSGFGALAVLDPAPCRPFDRRRAGLNLGEGAGFVVLEHEDHARARGQAPIAVLLGAAMGGEAHHVTSPEADGKTATRIMRSALQSAGLAPSDVGYVNAHGTATPLNDRAEATAIRACFGDQRVHVSSSKGQIGHTLGAAGAIEAVIAAHVVSAGVIPPTAGLDEPDPGCDIDHVLASRPLESGKAVMSNSFGFGGTGATLVIGPASVPAPAPVEPRASLFESAGSSGELVADSHRKPGELVVTGVAVLALGVVVTDLGELSAFATNDLGSLDAEAIAPSARRADPTERLDPARTRRMDRAGRLATAVMSAALGRADLGAQPLRRSDAAAISGTSFGNVDGSTRFMNRVLDLGAHLASPVDFPNLVPSSPVSHAAIYLGLGGPALATPDLSATAESAVATGLELCAAGLADAAVAGSIEEVSELADRVLAPLLGLRTLQARSEGASAIVIERASAAAERGKRPLAIVRFWSSARGSSAAASAPPPRPGACVIAEPSVDVARAVANTPWAAVECFVISPSAGDHVGLGGVAMVAAVARVSLGRSSVALVLGEAPDRSYAFVIEPPGDAADPGDRA